MLSFVLRARMPSARVRAPTSIAQPPGDSTRKEANHIYSPNAASCLTETTASGALFVGPVRGASRTVIAKTSATPSQTKQIDSRPAWQFRSPRPRPSSVTQPGAASAKRDAAASCYPPSTSQRRSLGAPTQHTVPELARYAEEAPLPALREPRIPLDFQPLLAAA